METGKQSASISIRYLILIIFVVSLFVSEAAATQIDFTDDQFEYAAYHELYSLIGLFTDTAPELYCEGRGFYESNFRLVPGRITFYDITGNPNAYLYIGYFGPGDTPTLETLVSKSIETYDDRQQLTVMMMQSEDATATYREFGKQHFPELLYTNYIILGVNLEEAAYEYRLHPIPHIILYQKLAEDMAKEYFNKRNVSFVRYIWGSKINGYEYTDGSNNIVIPFDMERHNFYPETIYTREEIDNNIDDFTARDEKLDYYMREAYKNFWDTQKRRLESESSDTGDSY